MNAAGLPPLVSELKKTPISLARLLDGLTPGDLAWKPSASEFSILENVWHLRDIEEEGYLVRVRRLRAEPHPVLPDIDGDRLAAERRYNEQPLQPGYEGFARARRLATEAVADATDQDLARPGTLEKTGPVTLGSILEMMREHDADHLGAVRSLRERILEGRP
ncbi:MAG: DinB family protein [Candidatus Polarisedimenticolia bacterium]